MKHIFDELAVCTLQTFQLPQTFFQKGHSHLLPKSFHKCTTLCTCILIDLDIVISKHTLNWVGVHTLQATFKY